MGYVEENKNIIRVRSSKNKMTAYVRVCVRGGGIMGTPGTPASSLPISIYVRYTAGYPWVPGVYMCAEFAVLWEPLHCPYQSLYICGTVPGAHGYPLCVCV